MTGYEIKIINTDGTETIERKFECDGPFILCDGFVEKEGENKR